MKTIGLLGGMSWESSLHYYRMINEQVRRRLGGLHSAECLLYSVDFAPIERMQAESRWSDAAARLGEAAEGLARGGADFLVLCTNTMHKVADAIERSAKIPLLHIADATGLAIQRSGVSSVGLLGTRFTMEESFYRGRLSERHGLGVRVPADAERTEVHRVIYEELCLGRIEPRSRQRLQEICAGLVAAGAEGIILGCTELTMLLAEGDLPVPLYDTTHIHAIAAAEHALEGDPTSALRDLEALQSTGSRRETVT